MMQSHPPTQSPTAHDAALSVPQRARAKKAIPLPALFFGLTALGLSLLTWLHPASTDMTLERIETGLLQPLARLLVYLGIGLFAGQAMERLGWAYKLAVPVRPLMRMAGLRDESGVAFVTAFVSNLAANTLLAGYYKEGRITQKEMTLTYLLNTGLPVFLVHLPTTFFIIAPLAKTAGLIYLGICFIAAWLKSMLVFIYCRLTLGRTSSDLPPSPDSSNTSTDMPPKPRSKGLLAAFRKRFTRIVLYTVPVYIIIFLLTHLGFFAYLRTALAHNLSLSIFPVESASVVILTLAAEFTSGAAAAGALLDTGVLDVKQTVLALLLGAIAATPIRAIRHQFPSQAGIFSPALALKQLCISQALRIGSIIVVAVPCLAWL